MNQGIQSILRNQTLRDRGCYFLCLLKWAELVGNRNFDEEQIDYLFDQSLRMELVNKNSLVLVPHGIVNTAIQCNRFRSIIWPFPVEQPTNHPIYITYLEKPRFGHFVLTTGNTVWDPLDPTRPGANDYRPVSYRIIV